MAFKVVNPVLFHITLGIFIFSVIFFTVRLLVNNPGSLRRTYCQDVMMVVTFILYTASILLINVCNAYPSSISDNEPDSSLSDSEYLHQLVVGSVLVIASEQTILFTVWAIKICVITFLYRLTEPLPSARLVLMVVTAYISSGLIALEVCFYAVICIPFSGYWSLPVENPQCASHLIFATTEMVLDISAILFIMAVASFVAYQSNLPKSRIIILSGLILLSAFIIASAALKRFYKNGNPKDLAYSLWCIMELSTMLWIANGIHFWPLFQKLFNCGTFAYSFTHTIQNPISGQTPSRQVPVRVTHIAWGRLVTATNLICRHLVTALTRRRVRNVDCQDVEMVNSNIHRIRHAASASMGTTIVMHAELAEYLENGPPTPHSQQLKRDEETSPALLYRETHQID